MTLNEEYSVVCKGWKAKLTGDSESPPVYQDSHGKLHAQLPDYANDDAELGRMVKALAKRDLCLFGLTLNGNFVMQYQVQPPVPTHSGRTLNEAAMRACIALKLQVPE